MGARGPKPGSGGRPRSKQHKPNARDGYSRETVGPKGRGTQEYTHRVKAGVTHAGPNVTVDHVGSEGHIKKGGPLQVVSRSENVRREDKARGRKKR